MYVFCWPIFISLSNFATVFGHLPEIALVATFESDFFSLNIFVTDNNEVRDFFKLGGAHFFAKAPITFNQFTTNICFTERRVYFLGFGMMWFVDRNDIDLYGCEPEGEGSHIFLNQESNNAFDGADR